MRILDIDLDYFAQGALYFPDETAGRPPAEIFPPWDATEVEEFLEENCGLTKSKRIPGFLIETHDQAFYIWNELLDSKKLYAPFEVVHVDAHADLGLGDASYVYILKELLKYPPEKRVDYLCRSKLYEGNYLAFALACRWISSLTYVQQSDCGTGGDLLGYYFRDYDDQSGYIEMPIWNSDTDLALTQWPRPERREPAIPFRNIGRLEYKENTPFDYGSLSISPAYTAQETEKLIPVISEYIDLIEWETK